MTGKLLAGVSALVLGLAMSPAAMAGTADGNTANGLGDDEVTASDNDTTDSNNLTDSQNSDTDITLGAIGVAVSFQTLEQTTTNQTFNAPVVAGGDPGGTLNMDASIGENTAQNAAGVVQTNAQSGFQTQAQQGSSIAAVGTVNIGGGANAGGGLSP